MVRIAAAACLFTLSLACIGVSGEGKVVDREDGGNPDAGHPDGRVSYSYEGCDDAGFYGCPGLLQLYCAAEVIEDKHNACVTASDCTPVRLNNCAAIFDCPPAAVNTAQRAAFEAELAVELERYCSGGCYTAGLCAYTYYSGGVECRNGRCVAFHDDAGTP